MQGDTEFKGNYAYERGGEEGYDVADEGIVPVLAQETRAAGVASSVTVCVINV